MSRRMTLSLAGPISGKSYDVARMDFSAAARLLERHGYEVVNPMDHTYRGMPREKCMRIAIGKLLECDGVALMPGWEKSLGAQLEHAVATQCGIVASPEWQWIAAARAGIANG